MTLSPSPKHRLFLLGAAALAALLVAGTDTSRAGPGDPFNPYGVFTDSGPTTAEEKAKREQFRSDLYDRLSGDYRMSVPFVSEAAIAGLEQAIARYQQIVADGGWEAIPGKVTLRKGDSGFEIQTIRQHLAIEGDLPPGAGQSPKFDDEFLIGLSRFQIRNGLPVTGFVDRRTLAALNVPAVERLRQLQTNLPRLQALLPINKAPRYVLVNVPAYTAQAVAHGQLALDSPVVVGKPQRATPKVDAKIVEVNFYPTWTVPDMVARNDLIPAIRKDPNYIYEQHFTVMKDWHGAPVDPATIDWASPEAATYRFRQDSGPFNALGLVRINMPNKHSVYMHDTPLKRLFGQSARAFSSGCVRVERVFELVAWLLSEQKGWDLARVQQEIDSGKKLDVKLKKPVPVHFVYLTAFAGENGIAQFRPDIYGRDAAYAESEELDAVAASQSQAITP